GPQRLRRGAYRGRAHPAPAQGADAVRAAARDPDRARCRLPLPAAGMMIPSRQDWLIIGALLLAALLLGAITGAWTAMLLLAVLVWAGLQHRELSTFVAWARRPLARPRNRLETWQRARKSVV